MGATDDHWPLWPRYARSMGTPTLHGPVIPHFARQIKWANIWSYPAHIFTTWQDFAHRNLVMWSHFSGKSNRNFERQQFNKFPFFLFFLSDSQIPNLEFVSVRYDNRCRVQRQKYSIRALPTIAARTQRLNFYLTMAQNDPVNKLKIWKAMVEYFFLRIACPIDICRQSGNIMPIDVSTAIYAGAWVRSFLASSFLSCLSSVHLLHFQLVICHRW